MGGAHFQVFGEIDLDTGPAVEGVKEISSAILTLGKSGVAAFEAVQEKVIAATKQVAALRNALLQTQDPARQKELNAQLTDATTRLGAAKTEMRGMTLESREANEKIQMLAASLGVRVPQGLAQILARMPAVQAAIGLAFGGTIIVAFGAAILALFPVIDAWIDKLRGIEPVTADLLTKVAELNRFVVSGGKPEAVSWLRTELRNVTGEISRVEEHLKRLTTAQQMPGMQIPGGLKEWWNRGEVALLEKQLADLKKRYEELGSAIPTERVKEFNKAVEEGAERSRKALLGLSDVMFSQWEDVWALQKQALDAEKAANEAIGRGRHDLAITTMKDEEEIIRTMEEHGRVFDERIIRQSKEAQEATKEAAQAQQQALEATAGQIESFIDRVFLTARSLSDVFHQFLMQLLGSFVKWASRMIAQAILGMQQISGAGGGVGGGGIGGLLGPILGGVFGLGGGTSAMAATGGAWTGQPGQLGLPIGMGGMALSGGGGIPSAMGGAAQGGLGYAAFHPGQLLTNLATLGPLAAILGGASLMGSGGVGRGVAGGMLAAGGISYALFGLAGLGVLPLAIGALVGGIIGMVRRGRQKRRSAGLEQGFEFAADDVFAAYQLHKLDYESAISQLEGLMASGQQTLLGAGTGRWGRQGAENLTRVIRDLIARVNDLEKQRQATTTTLAGMTIPEFALGGQVGSWQSAVGRGGILAILHPGEFVMRQQAVDYLGQNFLAALNRAPAFAAGGNVGARDSGFGTRGRGINIENLNVYPERGMSDREAMNMVVRGFNLATREGAL